MIEALEGRFLLSVANPNQAITTNSGVQQNPSIAVDPTNSKHLVASYMDYSLLTTGYAGIGVAVSKDGGVSWSHTTIPLPANFDQGAATPVTQFDNSGHVFVSFSAATFLGTKPGLTDPDFSDRENGDGFTSNNGIFVSESADGGLHWNTPVAVASHLYDGTNPVLFDVTPDLAIDTFAKLPNGKTNPNYDDLYEVWTRNYTPGTFPGDPGFTGGTDGMIAVSKDDGKTWHLETNKAGVTAIDDPVRSLSDAGPGLGYVDQVHVTVGPEGDVYVAEYGGGDFSVLLSTNGGQSFAAPDHNSNQRLAFGAGFNSYSDSTLDNDQFRTNSLRDIVADPTRPGVVYAVDVITSSSDQADVYFARSSDYGVTWTSTFNVGGVPASVLNDDVGLNDGHAMARLQVAPNGDLAVIWYDTRVDPANTALNVFATVSTDGGVNWSSNFRISDTTFDPNAGAFTDAAGNQNYYLGDFIGLTLTDTAAYATWTDTQSGNQDIESASFALNPAPAALNDRFEPNNTVAQATDLGTVFTTTVPQLDITSGDTDWYSFTPAAAGQMMLEASQTGASSAHLQLQLFDSTGGTLLATGSDVIDSSGSVVGVQISAPGVSGTNYLLRVVPIGGGTSYSLQLQGLTENLGTQVYGDENNVLVAGQQNDYLITAAAAGTLDVDLTPGSDATGSFSLNVLSSDGQTTLAAGAASGTTAGGDQTASLSVTQGESILLEVSGDTTTAGTYGLSFSDLDQTTLAASSTLIPAGTDPSQTVVSDLTGNGKQDIVVAGANSDTISVLMNNGNGTFQAPRQYTVGPFGSTAKLTSGTLPNFRRAIAVADFNGDGIPDIVVTNYASGDVSVLLGNGDGTFQPQRRFNAVADPFDLAVGDLTGNHIQDIVVVSANSTPDLNLLQETVGVLVGRGDGTFLPPKTFTVDLPAGDEYPLSSVQISDINGDGVPDLVLSGGSDSDIRIFYGRGDGTFATGPVISSSAQQGTALTIADLTGNNNPDIIAASLSTGALYAYESNDNGKFTTLASLGSFAGAGPIALAMGDFGSENSDGSLGAPDGAPDLIVADSGETFGLPNSSALGVSVLPSIFSDGTFEGFGYPIPLPYAGTAPQDVSVGDFNGDGVTDIAVTDTDGIHIIYGGTPTILPNDTPQSALNLGNVTHLAEPTLSIVPGHEDAYFDLNAPVEADSAAGDEVLDFSGLFQHQTGGGLTMDVTDSAGDVLGSGDRLRIDTKQGEALVIHVHGNDADSAGAFTLDVDALPQIVSVAAESPLPGTPATSIVVTLQGDRLDPTTAENSANYQVIWLGPDGVAGTSDDRVISVGSGDSIVYDPGANLDVTSGKVYPTAVKQTVTLLFDQALPVGSYEIKLSSAIESAAIGDDESSLLQNTTADVGHPLVSLSSGNLVAGATIVQSDLVSSSDQGGNVDELKAGTPFLAQLHADLNAILDSQLSKTGDNSGITPALIAQLLARFAPAIQAAGLPPYVLLFLDPVSLNLADPNGNHVSYDLQTNTVTNQSPDAFVSVTGNVEVLVMPLSTGTYNLNVANAPVTARGGLAIVGGQSQQTIALTDAIRSGQSDFAFGITTNFAGYAQLASFFGPQSAPSSDSNATSDAEPTDTPAASTSSASDTTASSAAAPSATVAVNLPLPDDASDEADQNPNQRKKKRGNTTQPAQRVHPTTATASLQNQTPSEQIAPTPIGVALPPLPLDWAPKLRASIANASPTSPTQTLSAANARASDTTTAHTPAEADRGTNKLLRFISGMLISGALLEAFGGTARRRVRRTRRHRRCD